MGIDAEHLSTYVIRPILLQLELYSLAAERLLLGTAAQESQLGRYLRQIRGPALGIYQMEPDTHNDVHRSFLRFNSRLRRAVMSFASGGSGEPAPNQLVWNLAYATAMSRVYYLRIQEPLPKADDIDAMARYWKKYYNTVAGKGTEEEFKRNFNRFISLRSISNDHIH